MDVQEVKLSRFLEGSGKQFIIPVYQRDYAWKVSECQRLWADITSLAKGESSTHFLGTIVTINDGMDKNSIIDGQQRLTTSSLILLAILNYLKSKNEKSIEDEKLKEQVENFLINKWEVNDNSKIKLKPNKQDKESFTQLFEGKYDSINNNITNNFLFFLNQLKSNSLTAQEVFDTFAKLKIVSIQLTRGQDDPQLIFESLNSTGVDLEQADLIRNFILMDLEPDLQEKYYNQYWRTIEKNAESVTEFFRMFLIYKTTTYVRSFEVYSLFKKYYYHTNQNKENVLVDLDHFSKMYSYVTCINEYQNKEIHNKLEDLVKIDFTVATPYLFDLFEDLDKGLVSESTVLEILKLIQSQIFRKLLVDNGTQGFNKMYITFAKEIKKNEDWKENYFEILKYNVLSRKNATRFPSDEEVISSLLYKDIYNLRAKSKNFLFKNIENFKNPYKLDNETIESLTVEHIMPQTLKDSDKKALGDNYQEIHKKYLHTLGNLTLTANNSALSNNDFEVKQNIDFNDSKLVLSRPLNINQSMIWGPDQIEARTKELTAKILDIWPYPITKYQSKTELIETYDLESEIMPGLKPKIMIINEVRIPIRTWKDFYKLALEAMRDYSPIDFKQALKDASIKLLIKEESKCRVPLQLFEDTFIEYHMQSVSMFFVVSKIADLMKLNSEFIKFEI
jgi:uncharacterized protein with ParB-like and HNH nuclease domain